MARSYFSHSIFCKKFHRYHYKQQFLLSFPEREGGPAEWLVDRSDSDYQLDHSSNMIRSTSAMITPVVPLNRSRIFRISRESCTGLSSLRAAMLSMGM